MSPSARDGRLRVFMAFCLSGVAHAEAQGSLARPATVDDPAFARLLASMATLLIPGTGVSRPRMIDQDT